MGHKLDRPRSSSLQVKATVLEPQGKRLEQIESEVSILSFLNYKEDEQNMPRLTSRNKGIRKHELPQSFQPMFSLHSHQHHLAKETFRLLFYRETE